MRFQRTKRRRHLGSLAAAACLGLAATAAVLASTATAGHSSLGGSSQDKVTLTVWGFQESPGRIKVQNQLASEFGKKNNVEIKWVRKSFNDLSSTIKLGLSGPSAPDIAQLPQGWPMVDLVKANLLVPLNKYSARYGWKKRFPSGLLRDASATADGTHFGTGNLYGISLTLDFLGVYYNKAKLKALGLSVPKTFSQFQADLAAAQDAGETAIEFGNADKYPLAHFSYQVLPQFISKAKIRSFVYGNGHPSIVSNGAQKAAQTLQGWAESGYLSKGYDGLGADDAFARFATKDEGVFYVGGSWLIANLAQDKALKKVGFFAMPPQKAGAPPATCGTGGNPYAISTRSKNPDVAAAFLNYLSSPHAAGLFASVANDFPGPVYSHATAAKGTTLADAFAALTKLQRADGLTPWLDWATPTMYDTLTATLQELLAGKTSPQKFLASAQKDEDKFLKSLGR